MKYAVVESGGKQYRVSEGDTVHVEKLNAEDGAEVSLDKVLLVADEDNVKVGKPYLEGARVVAKVLAQGKRKKVIVFKYKPKKNYRKKTGHRQPFTRLQIERIEA